jgi:thiol:disulfide interchange protein DsbD
MKRILIPIVLLFAIFAYTNAQDGSEHARFKASPSQSQVSEGDEFFIKFNFDIDKYWYTYDFVMQVSEEGIGPMETQLAILSDDMAEVNGEIIKPKPLEKFDEGFKFDITYYKGNFDVILPVKALKDINFESDVMNVEIYIQLCDTVRCLPPEPYELRVGADVFNPEDYDFFVNREDESLAETDESGDDVIVTESSAEIEETKKKGVWSFLWFAMLAGAAALLTPCVFPMIPITVSFFTKRAENSKAKGLRDSVIYALGIIITFTGIGFALAAILGPTGIRDFAADGWVNMFIAAIFVIFALNLFGAFEIQIPTGIMNKLNKKTQGAGIGSILAMGLVFSLTSFTCTVPFVGSALISATGGEWFYPVIGMLGFSTVFALPFFIFALIPSAMNKLPKAGGWMNNVKVIMGFLEVAAAIKFISNADLVWEWGIMPRDFFLAIWIICGILIVAYLLGAFRMKLDSEISNLSAVRVVWAIVFGAITVYLLPGLFGKGLGELDAFLPPKGYLNASAATVSSAGGDMFGGGSESKKSVWLNNYEEALALAKEENKPIFIDFTGWTCTNCRWMESNVFPLPEVQNYFADMINVKLYTDRRKEPELTNKKFQEERFNSIELPLYVILTPDEKLVGTKAFTRDLQEFLDFLEKGKNSIES